MLKEVSYLQLPSGTLQPELIFNINVDPSSELRQEKASAEKGSARPWAWSISVLSG